MDPQQYSLVTHFREHFKKILLLCTCSATIFLVKKYMDKRKLSNAKKEKRKIKEFPTIEEIQKFIEELPFDAVKSDKNVTLKDLLGELSEFSEDEDWKELIASVHNMYKENPAKELNTEDTGSIISIYEDPNVIVMRGNDPELLRGEPKSEFCDENTVKDTLPNIGDGDTDTAIILDNCDECQKEKENSFEVLDENVGDGDNFFLDNL